MKCNETLETFYCQDAMPDGSKERSGCNFVLFPFSEEIKKEFEVPANTFEYLPCLPHESIEIIIK